MNLESKFIIEAGEWHSLISEGLDGVANGGQGAIAITKKRILEMQPHVSKECYQAYAHVYNGALMILYGNEAIKLHEDQQTLNKSPEETKNVKTKR